MDAQQEILRLLKDVGAAELPAKKHAKFRLPNGRTFVMASTPSDRRGRLNELTRLKKLLRIPARV